MFRKCFTDVVHKAELSEYHSTFSNVKLYVKAYCRYVYIILKINAYINNMIKSASLYSLLKYKWAKRFVL